MRPTVKGQGSRKVAYSWHVLMCFSALFSDYKTIALNKLHCLYTTWSKCRPLLCVKFETMSNDKFDLLIVWILMKDYYKSMTTTS